MAAAIATHLHYVQVIVQVIVHGSCNCNTLAIMCKWLCTAAAIATHLQAQPLQGKASVCKCQAHDHAQHMQPICRAVWLTVTPPRSKSKLGTHTHTHTLTSSTTLIHCASTGASRLIERIHSSVDTSWESSKSVGRGKQ